MMEKISIQDIANVLVEKNGIKKKDADQFVMAIFELVKEGLKQDKLVKIKGFGTFKIIDIEARESVNVNTGERVMIAGHDKITFTPDAAMKELVNRPFSQFETVQLNDGVEFDDADFADIPEPTIDGEEPSVEENVAVVEKPAQMVEQPEPAAEEEAPTAEEPEPAAEEEAPTAEEPEPAAGEEAPTIQESSEPTYYLSDDDNTKSVSLRTCLLSVVLACLLGGVVGYFFRAMTETPTLIVEPADEILEEKAPEKEDAQKSDSTKKQPAQTTPKQETAPKEAVPYSQASKPDENPAKEQANEAKPKAGETKTKAGETKAPAEATGKDYDKMDARVRLGAYRITGVSHVVKARAGDTTAKIARRTLGPDMECYIEVLNGIKGGTPLQEGQDIKIPKIELKKKKQKKTEQ